MEAGPRSYGGQQQNEIIRFKWGNELKSSDLWWFIHDEREVVQIGEYQKWGGMASYSVAPVKAVSSLPQPLDMAQAATLNGELDSYLRRCLPFKIWEQLWSSHCNAMIAVCVTLKGHVISVKCNGFQHRSIWNCLPCPRPLWSCATRSAFTDPLLSQTQIAWEDPPRRGIHCF